MFAFEIEIFIVCQDFPSLDFLSERLNKVATVLKVCVYHTQLSQISKNFIQLTQSQKREASKHFEVQTDLRKCIFHLDFFKVS